jgi:hypothetical protein
LKNLNVIFWNTRPAPITKPKPGKEFINPFFKALGWDMDNEQGFSGAYKEVVHEASLKVGNTTKAPDYAFKIGESINSWSKQKSLS